MPLCHASPRRGTGRAVDDLRTRTLPRVPGGVVL
ncbi:hypothetical protein CLV63_13826 [Murinocardiopsis flavida]|uniref:Uncharacterized protein n=1 Tax=Murinocardiopsis flavida TaxID=645275 RepID=A0A2P8CJ78_9ACTN|nr:hypothetical protein CLV63_13826 [Murinocardiopsis flavida]